MHVYAHLRRPRQPAYLHASASKGCSVVVHRDALRIRLEMSLYCYKNGQRPPIRSQQWQRSPIRLRLPNVVARHLDRLTDLLEGD